MINNYEKTPVLLLDLEGKIIQEFDSISRASKALNVPSTTIVRILAGKQLETKKSYFFVNKSYYSSEKNYSLKFRKSKKNLLKTLKINKKITSEIYEKKI